MSNYYLYSYYDDDRNVEVANICQATLEMPHPDGTGGYGITRVHVCGLEDGHAESAHRCRKPKCGFWWRPLDHNPFGFEDNNAGDPD